MIPPQLHHGTGPRVTAAGELVWPSRGSGSSAQQQGLILPLAAAEGESAAAAAAEAADAAERGEGIGGAAGRSLLPRRNQRQHQRGCCCCICSSSNCCCFRWIAAAAANFAAACRAPIWGFPPSSIERPLNRRISFLWFPPFFGFSPFFWLLILAAAAAAVAAHILLSPVCITIMVICLCLLAISLHEFSHSIVAFKLGVDHVAEYGYLQCDIFQYMDICDILFSAFFIATGGISFPSAKVQLNVNSIRSRAGRMSIALAGPLCHMVLALLTSICVQTYLLFNEEENKRVSFCLLGLVCFIFLQLMAFILNLLPLPPLDGWRAIEPYLPADCCIKYFLVNYRYGERISFLFTSLLLYCILSKVPIVWRLFAYISAVFTGLPPSIYLRCMYTMMHPFSYDILSSPPLIHDFMRHY